MQAILFTFLSIEVFRSGLISCIFCFFNFLYLKSCRIFILVLTTKTHFTVILPSKTIFLSKFNTLLNSMLFILILYESYMLQVKNTVLQLYIILHGFPMDFFSFYSHLILQLMLVSTRDSLVIFSM